jgi:hypothetical protein
MGGNRAALSGRPIFEHLKEVDVVLGNRSLLAVAASLSVVVVLGGCAVSEERGGPGADGTPLVAVACVEDVPDCEDTVITNAGSNEANPGVETTGSTLATTSAEPETMQTIQVAFATTGGDWSDVARFERQADASLNPAEAAFRDLVAGPTGEEAARGADAVIYSVATSGTVRSVTLDDGLLLVDFSDFQELIANASTSCGSMSLLSQLNTTAFQFDDVERVRYEIEGSCNVFSNWLQRECTEYTRNGAEAAQP